MNQIFVIEHDSTSKIKPEKEVRHIFLQNNSPFNRSWCFNVGYRHDEKETYKIAFTDADLIIDKKKFISCLNLLNDYDCVSPYTKVIDLDKHGIGKERTRKINFCDGMVMFTRPAIEKIAGWGVEDEVQTFKVNLMGLKKIEVPGNITHLYHEFTGNREQYDKNFSFYKKILKKNRRNMENYFSWSRPKIGNIETPLIHNGEKHEK